MSLSPQKTNVTGRHSKAARISVFNHKGGVGKTTLTFNVASQLASMGKRVLLVDTDPQCNLSAYVIDPEVLDDLLDNSDKGKGATLWSAVRPLVEGTGDIKAIEPTSLNTRLDLLCGDIKLSDFEADLSDFWRDCFQRKKRGFLGTSAISRIVDRLCLELGVDLVFYDSGPNIGPLNRVILLDCDFFIVPVAYDLFSVRALTTLGRSLFSWVSDWNLIKALAPPDTYLLSGRPSFLGYITQDFSVYRGGVAHHQAKYANLLERGMQTDIVQILKRLEIVAPNKKFKLGEIKNLGQLVSASQNEGRPVFNVSAGNAAQRDSARRAFRTIATKIIEATEPKK